MFSLLFSTRIREQALHIGLLLFRVSTALSMLFHGYHKLAHFSEMASQDFWCKDINFLGKGGAFSLGLTIFAEFFCSLFLMLGLATRLVLIPLLFCMGYIVLKVDHGEWISSGEHGMELNHAFFYFILFFTLLLSGPGRWSIDRLITK